jgi:hypothetical protein
MEEWKMKEWKMKEWKTENGTRAVTLWPFAIFSSSILSSSIHRPSNLPRL